MGTTGTINYKWKGETAIEVIKAYYKQNNLSCIYNQSLTSNILDAAKRKHANCRYTKFL